MRDYNEQHLHCAFNKCYCIVQNVLIVSQIILGGTALLERGTCPPWDFCLCSADSSKEKVMKKDCQLACSHLAAILETLGKIPDMEPEADGIVIDGSALVNSLPPRTSKTFEDYAALDVLPTIQAYSTEYKQMDIVFDVYDPSSLKSETRSKRGRGVRRRMTSTSKLPSNWQNF